MAKSKKRSKSKQAAKIDWGGPASKGTGRFNLILGGVAVAALIAGGIYWWLGRATLSEFMALAAEGQAALERVDNPPNLGQNHLRPRERRSFGTSTPTSGPHDTFPIPPGFYDSPQLATRLLHSLEHGLVVLYYDKPTVEAMAQLESWASLFTGRFDGLVVTRLSGLGQNVVVTAWRKKLDLAPFDPAAAAAFIDAYRGRGPENQVR